MRSEWSFKAGGDGSSIREGVRAFLEGSGWRLLETEESGCVFGRGSRRARLFSLRTELWPARLRVTFLPLGPETTGLLLRFEVETGFHLVGALDRAVLESEVAALEEYLVTGRRIPPAEGVQRVRRPVMTAAMLNMVLAAAVVAWIGVLGRFPLPWIAAAALAVAVLDGVVILAFADLVLEGARRLPRPRENQR